ncbi:1-acyl-sn-glycerol-3-phosphate acyltransferase epsilon [Galendromus occidentalis]|uniref:1-acyl-sn-glycerol-3-phosphate acyltransferase epsilon n=1 Tax=Galendromus occidentalis TaxID=34638 RepID=A0AAJ6QPW9_9ACAR|nr:1-acyl-sn-glycerol-3-phosphate acyltransferase epsilon [Galendromus occidentalis]
MEATMDCAQADCGSASSMTFQSVLLKWVRIYFNLFVLLGTAGPLYIAWFIWRMVSLPLPAHIYQRGDDFIFEYYQRLALILAETFAGLEIHFYGDFKDIMDKRENFLLMSNHQTASDWIMNNSVAERFNCVGHMRYFMKDFIKLFPLYGFYFYHHGCIYVNRKNCDFEKMRRNLVYLQNKRISTIVTIFPEGTRYRPELLEESHKFADKNFLRRLNHVLYPRTRGLGATIDYMRHNVEALYDLTVIYDNTKVDGKRVGAPSLIALFTGDCPVVHVHLERIPIADIPKEEAEIKDFILNQFLKKEELLSKYYDDPTNTQPFPGGALQKPLNHTRQMIVLAISVIALCYFCFTWSGISIIMKVWIMGTLFGYGWLLLNHFV